MSKKEIKWHFYFSPEIYCIPLKIGILLGLGRLQNALIQGHSTMFVFGNKKEDLKELLPKSLLDLII